MFAAEPGAPAENVAWNPAEVPTPGNGRLTGDGGSNGFGRDSSSGFVFPGIKAPGRGAAVVGTPAGIRGAAGPTGDRSQGGNVKPGRYGNPVLGGRVVT